MSNIDERVVKMEFDNKAFEKNAEDTISLLDKLKESLKFDKVKDSFSNITKAAKKVDVSGIDNSVQTVKASFSAMEIAGITAIANLTNSLMNFAKRTVGGLWSQTVQGGIRRAFNIEKAKFTIEGLGKSFKKLEEDINYAVSGTAYGFDEAAMAASSMSASGVKAGDEMKRALRGISGMAAMTGSSYSDMANIFTTVAGNGRLLSQQLNQFSARGMNAAATLRDYINKDSELMKKLIDAGLKSTNAKQVKEFANATKLTEKNVRALVSGSVIDFNLFAKAMDETFGEHAKAANKTFNGVMSNIKATLSRIGEAFIHPLIANNDMDNMLRMVKSPLQETIKLTKEQRKEQKTSRDQYFDNLRQIKGFEKKTNAEIRAEYKKNPKAFLKQVESTKSLSKGFAKSIKEMMLTPKEQFISNMKKTTKVYFNDLRKIKGFEKKTNAEIIAEYKKNPKEFMKQVRTLNGHRKDTKKYFMDIIKYSNASDKTLSKMYGEYSNVQYNLVGVLQAVKRLFGAFETGIKNSKFLTTFQKTAVKACKALILLFNGLAATFGNVEKHGKKVVEIIGKKSHFISAERIWERLRKVLGFTTDEFDNIKKAIKGVGDIFSAFVYVIKEVAKAFLPTKKEAKGFRSSVLDVAGSIGEALSSFADFIKKSSTIAIIVNVLKTAFSILYKAINLLLIPIKLIIAGVSNLIKSFKIFEAPLNAVKNIFKNVFGVFKGIGKTFLNTGKKIISAFLKPFTKEAKKAEKPGEGFSGVLEKIATSLKAFGAKAGDFKNWITGVIDKFVDFNKITAIGQNIKNVIDNTIIPAFKNFGKFIKDHIPKIKLPNFGEMLSKSSGDVKKGMTNFKAPDFGKIFSNIADSIKNGVSKIKLPDFGKMFSNAFSTVGDAILSGFDAIKNFDYGAVFESIKEGFSNFIEFLGEAKNKIGEAFSKIGEGIKNNLPTFDEFANKLFEGFKKAVDNISNMLPEPNSFGAMLGDWIAAVISFVAKSIPYFVQILAAGFRTLVSHLPKIITDLANGIKEALNKGLFEPITVGTGKFKREIPPLFDVVADTLKSIGKKFKGATLDDILGWLNKFLTAGALNQLRKTLKSSEDISFGVGKFLTGLSGATDKELPSQNKGLVNKLLKLSEALKNFAMAIAIITAAVVVLGNVSGKSLKQGKEALLQLALGIAGFALALSLIQKFTGADLTGILSGLSGFIEGMKGLLVVLMAMTMVKHLEGPLAALGAVLIELGIFVFAVNKISGNAATAAAAMKSLGAFIGSLGELIKMLVVLAVVPADKIYNAIIELGLVLGELATLLFVLSKIPVDGALKAVGNLIPIIVMLGIAIGALWLIKQLELDPKQLMWIAGAFAVLGLTMTIAGSYGAGIANAISALAALAIFITGLLAILYVLSELNKNPKVKEFVDSGGELLKQIGVAIGGLIGGFAEGVMASAPAIADDLSAFAEHLKPFIDTMAGMKGNVSENIKNVTGAIKSLVEANLGEAFSKFLGGGDLSSLAERFGEFITSFKKVMEGIPESGKGFDSKLKQIGQIAKVTETLAKVEKGLEAQGGLKAGVFGQKSFEKFISGVKKLFNGFVEIGKTSGEIKNLDNITKVKNIAKALADTLAALPGEEKGKFWLDLAGSSKLSKFAKDLIKFGDSVSDYVSKFSGIDTSQMESVTKSVSKSIKSIAKSVASKGNSKAFSNSGANAISTMASGVSNNSSKLSSAFNTAMSSALKGIKTSSFTKKGKELAKIFADAIKGYDASKAGSSLAKSAASGMSSQDAKSTASTSGGNVASGFINGISTPAKLSAAYNAGYKLGSKALQGIRKAIAEGSPSRKAMQSGQYTGEGFVIGIRKWMQAAVIAGRELGNSSISSLRRSLSNVNNIVNNANTTPVIRPVLDLSNVKMGANQISSMFNSRYALGLAGDVAATKVNRNRNLVINNSIKVEGSQDPTAFADELMKEIEIQARTYNG